MSNQVRIKRCDICHGDILSFHSWHADGRGLYHMECEMHRTPAVHKGIRYDARDASRSHFSFNDVDRRKQKKNSAGEVYA